MEQKHLLILIGLGFATAILWWTLPEKIQPEPALLQQTSTPSPTVSVEPSVTPSASVSATPSVSVTPTPSKTPIPTRTPTRTPLPTRTPTPIPTQTATPLPTPTPTPTPIPIPSNTPTPIPTTVSCAGSFAQEFLCLINNHRRANGRGNLSYDARLNQAALAHSQWMQSTGTLSHTGANGSTFAERCAAAGTNCWAENLAQGFTSASHLFTIWRNSAGHNANMLGSYSAIGLGTSGAYATTVFR